MELALILTTPIVTMDECTRWEMTIVVGNKPIGADSLKLT